MSADVVSLAAYRARRRDAVLPWVAMATLCFWPAFLVLAAGIGLHDAIAHHWGDR